MFYDMDEKIRMFKAVKEYTKLLLAKAKCDDSDSLCETDHQRCKARIRAAYRMLNMLNNMREDYYADEWPTKYQADNRPYVYAVRIFLENGYQPMAELAFGDGGRPNGQTKVIRWDSITERERYLINSYTLIWDEREIVARNTFQQYINNDI